MISLRAASSSEQIFSNTSMYCSKSLVIEQNSESQSKECITYLHVDEFSDSGGSCDDVDNANEADEQMWVSCTVDFWTEKMMGQRMQRRMEQE